MWFYFIYLYIFRNFSVLFIESVIKKFSVLFICLFVSCKEEGYNEIFLNVFIGNCWECLLLYFRFWISVWFIEGV